MARISSSSSTGILSIQDSNGNPITASGGSLNVNITGSASTGTFISEYNEVTAVAIAASANVLTYTVPPGQTLALSRVLVSSDSVATVQITFDSAINAKERLTFTSFNTTFTYDAYPLAAGTVITLTAINNSAQGPASFNATLQGVLS